METKSQMGGHLSTQQHSTCDASRQAYKDRDTQEFRHAQDDKQTATCRLIMLYNIMQSRGEPDSQGQGREQRHRDEVRRGEEKTMDLNCYTKHLGL